MRRFLFLVYHSVAAALYASTKPFVMQRTHTTHTSALRGCVSEDMPYWFDPLTEFGLDEPRPDPANLPLLLVLPGADGSGITPWMQYPSLAQEYRLQALCVPDGDRSSQPELVELVAREVVRLSSSPPSDPPVFLLGESMGAGVAIDVALRECNRLAGLVLVSPATGWYRNMGYKILSWNDGVLMSGRGPWPALLQAVLALTSYELLDAAQLTSTVRRVLTGEKSPLLLSPARTEYAWRVVSQLPARLALPPATAANRYRWAEPTFAAGKRVTELSLPVLCVAGTADLRVPAAEEARRFEREIPVCRCVYVEGAGHAGATDDRVDLCAELAAWRREVVDTSTEQENRCSSASAV